MRKYLLAVLLVGAAVLPQGAQAYNPGPKWAVNTVGWDLSGLGVSVWMASARDAMKDWNNAGARFSMVEYPGSQNTMTYYWSDSTVLGSTHRYLQYGLWGNIYRTTIKINNYYRFNPPYTSGAWIDLRTLLRHELGHTVALDHVGDYNAIMYPSQGYGQVRYLSSDEINGIQAMYGRR